MGGDLLVLAFLGVGHLAGSKLIDVDQSLKEDRVLFSGAQKLAGMLITLGEAVAYVLSGMYGEIAELGAGNAILIIVQLFIAGIIVIILDIFGDIVALAFSVGWQPRTSI